MHDRTYGPIPNDLQSRIAAMTHDLSRARELAAAGRITLDGQRALDRFFSARVERIEAEVHARLLHQARRGRAGHLN